MIVNLYSRLPLFLTFALFLAVTAGLSAQPLNGAYTINSGMPTAGSNFQSFTDFAAALDANGISGHVTATVAFGSGPYQEQVVFNSVTGSGANAVVTIEGNGQTITAVTSTTDRHVLRLANVQYFTINNLRAAWDPASTGGFYGIHLFGSADHVTISNCMVDLTGTISTLYGAYVASGSETSILSAGDFHNILINNNMSKGGGYGASVFGLSAGQLATNIVITNNEFLDFHSNGVYLRETDGATVADNFFDKTTAQVTSANAIQIAQNANLNAKIFRNFIQVSQTANGSVTFRGIYLFNGTGHRVYNNVIHNVNLTSGNFTGIEIRSAGTAPEIYFNTIAVDNPNATTGNLYGIKEELSNTNAILRNNLISLSQPTSGNKSGLVLGATAVVTTAFDTDYNIIYTPGGNTAQRGTLSPTLYGTLPTWQGASGQDANSLDLDPVFSSPTLSQPTNPAVDDAGTAIPFVMFDVAGVLRGSPPDIGAYEFGDCAPPDAPGAIFGETTLCANTSATYSVEAVTGAMSYNWSVPAGASVSSGQGTTEVEILFGLTSGEISVTAEDTCGISAPTTLAINLQTAPGDPAAILGPLEVCSGDVGVTYSIDPVAGAATYEWFVPSDATITAGQGTTAITVDFGAISADVGVVASNDCGESTGVGIDIMVLPNPVVTLVLPVDTVCSDAGLISLSGGSPVGGEWTGPGVTGDQFDPAEAGLGDHTIVYTYTEPTTGCFDLTSGHIVVVMCTDTDELATGAPNWQPAPNPSSGPIHILNTPPGGLDLRLIDPLGRIARQPRLMPGQGLDLSQLPAGVYWLEMTDGISRTVERVVKE